MGLDDVCNTTLVLGLGLTSNNDHKKMNKPVFKVGGNFESCLSLGLSDGHDDYKESVMSMVQNGIAVKRESEDVEKERASCKGSDVDDDRGSNNNIKKLRLNKDQSLVLEESFKLHRTLNHKQKQELARKLNVRARQIEVWFQNRRARTKVKQTQVDSEYLKKCYETLTEENRRLKKELQELKALELARPLYTRMPASATLTMCPSCETISGNGQRG